jgi:hypothetical protein
VIISDRRPASGGQRLVTIGEAARLTHSAREYVDKAIKRGKIPFQRIEGVRMVDLNDWIEWQRIITAKLESVR